MPGPNTPYTQLDYHQVIKQCFNENKDRLRVDAELSLATTTVEIVMSDIDDSVKIGDGTGVYLDVNPDGSINTHVLSSALPTGAATSALQTTGNTSLNSIDTSLDTVNQELIDIETEIAISSAYLLSLDTSIDVDLSTRASEATLVSFEAANHNDLLGVQIRQDSTNTKLDTANGYLQSIDTDIDVALSTRASELTLSNFKTDNHTDLLNIQTKQDTTNTYLNSIDTKVSTSALQTTLNTRIGDLTETAPITDTGSSGLNGRLQRIAQHLTNLLSYFNLNFGLSSSAIRTASQIGNSSGSADFNSGATGNQTLRTASNIYDSSGNQLTSSTVDSQNSINTVNVAYPETIKAQNGKMFHSSINSSALTGTSETAHFLFKNPPNSGKSAKLYRLTFGPTLGNNYVTYRVYLNPTITSDGTGIIEIGNKQTSQNSNVVNTFSAPSISSNGSLLKVITCSGLSGMSNEIQYNFSFWIEQNNNLLVTRQLSANATSGAVTIEWVEE